MESVLAWGGLLQALAGGPPAATEAFLGWLSLVGVDACAFLHLSSKSGDAGEEKEC